MSELIEINEGNCVLEEGDMRNVDLAFNFSVRNLGNDKNIKEIYLELFLKITKLNDLAKERKNGK